MATNKNLQFDRNAKQAPRSLSVGTQTNLISTIQEKYANHPDVLSMVDELNNLMAANPLYSRQGRYLRGVIENRYRREFTKQPMQAIRRWANQDIEDIISQGYLNALYKLSIKGAQRQVKSASEHANKYKSTPAEMLLFGNTGAREALTECVDFRRYHGQHIPYGYKWRATPEQKTELAQQIERWPISKNGKDLINNYARTGTELKQALYDANHDSYERRIAIGKKPVTGL